MQTRRQDLFGSCATTTSPPFFRAVFWAALRPSSSASWSSLSVGIPHLTTLKLGGTLCTSAFIDLPPCCVLQRLRDRPLLHTCHRQTLPSVAGTANVVFAFASAQPGGPYELSAVR